MDKLFSRLLFQSYSKHPQPAAGFAFSSSFSEISVFRENEIKLIFGQREQSSIFDPNYLEGLDRFNVMSQSSQRTCQPHRHVLVEQDVQAAF